VRRVELSDMQFGQVEGEIRMLKAKAIAEYGDTRLGTPARLAGRDRAAYLQGLIDALNKAETF
jgi:hypothetical protein